MALWFILLWNKFFQIRKYLKWQLEVNIKYKWFLLTHQGLVVAYETMEIGQHWFR